ncbi:MAG: hypothetical protein JSU70_21105 [Phycisphaerales bacterium]|nr:MAG: hypothetical protein JSU70_21105 [Phycisphaerales bacterium]
MNRVAVMVLLICAVSAGITQAGGDEQGGETYVLIVSGIIREPSERMAKERVVSTLRDYFLNHCRVEPKRLFLVTDKHSSARTDSQSSSAESLRKTIQSLARQIKPEDRFILYYAGQANVVAKKLRLNLPGKDITHLQLADWLNPIKAPSILVVLDCPGAGLAIKDIAGRGRIVLGACTGEQHYSTRFGEYFVGSLTDSESDADGDRRVSLLEAFTRTSQQLDDWYRQRHLLTTETPVLEDNGDGTASPRPWKWKQSGEDGMIASQFFLSTQRLKEVVRESEE